MGYVHPSLLEPSHEYEKGNVTSKIDRYCSIVHIVSVNFDVFLMHAAKRNHDLYP